MEFELAPDGQYVKHGADIFKRLKTRQIPYQLNTEQKTRRKLYMREYRAKGKTPKCETSKSAVCASDEKTNS
jgi:hypothetical protein